MALVELAVLQRDQAGIRRRHRALELRPARLIAQPDRHHGGDALAAEERLCILQRQEHAAVLEPVFRRENPGHGELALADRYLRPGPRLQKFRRAGAEPDAVRNPTEVLAAPGRPFRPRQARIGRLKPEAGDDRSVARGHVGQGAQGGGLFIRHAAEEQVRDVFLEHEVVRINGVDALEHADGSLDDRKDGEHRRHAEADARDPDEGAQLVPAQIAENERVEARGRAG